MSQPLESLLLAFRGDADVPKFDIGWPWLSEKLWKGVADAWVATDARRLILVPIARCQKPIFADCKFAITRKPQPVEAVAKMLTPDIWSDEGWRDIDESAPNWRESLRIDRGDEDEFNPRYQIDCEAEVRICDLRVAMYLLFDLLPYRPLFKRSSNNQLLAMGDAFRAVVAPFKEPGEG